MEYNALRVSLWRPQRPVSYTHLDVYKRQPHIPSLVMGAGLFTLGVAPAVMGLVYIVEGLSGLGKGRRKPDK